MKPPTPTNAGSPLALSDAVAGSMLLERLGTREWGLLAAIAEPTSFAAGDTLLREGAATPFLAYVATGRLALRLHVPERGPQTLLTVEPGELLGWSAIVPPYRSTAEAIALEATEIVTFEAMALRSLLEADQALAASLLPLVLEVVADRLTMSWHQLLDLFAGRTLEPW